VSSGHGFDSVVEAIVVEVLPNSMVRLKGPHETDLTAHVATSAKSVIVRVLPGDRVRVELSPYTPGRGRIVGIARRAAEGKG